MSKQTLALTPAVYDYFIQYSVRESALLASLREETQQLGNSAAMQIAREQGQLISLLLKLMNARTALELGTFTGYSSICIAQALAVDGVLITCDISEDNTQLAKKYWSLAGLENKIDLRIAPAISTLEALLTSCKGTFDFIFIDADKNNYLEYYELSLQLLRQNGLLMVDNVLWNGAVADPADQEKQTLTIRALNEKMLHDPRVQISMLPMADGITLALKS